MTIFSNGKEQISASRASKQTGYSCDYIGQLCRTKKITGQLIGRTWFVDIKELEEYKNNKKYGALVTHQRKDISSLVALSLKKNNSINSENLKNNLNFSYTKDFAPKFPRLSKRGGHESVSSLLNKSHFIFVSIIIITGFITAFSSINNVAANSIEAKISKMIVYPGEMLTSIIDSSTLDLKNLSLLGLAVSSMDSVNYNLNKLKHESNSFNLKERTPLKEALMTFMDKLVSREIVVTGRLNIDGALCAEDVCVNNEQLKKILIQAGGTSVIDLPHQ